MVVPLRRLTPSSNSLVSLLLAHLRLCSVPVYWATERQGLASGSLTINPAVNGTYSAGVQSGACQVGAAPIDVGIGEQQGSGLVPLFDESEITVRVLADRSVADWFVQGGRWAASDGWQATDARKPADSNVMVWSGTTGVSAQVDVYGMGCGWLNPSYTENPTL